MNKEVMHGSKPCRNLVFAVLWSAVKDYLWPTGGRRTRSQSRSDAEYFINSNAIITWCAMVDLDGYDLRKLILEAREKGTPMKELRRRAKILFGDEEE